MANFKETLILQHKSPDYSAVYIVFKTDGETGVEGHGLTFTLGRGNELGMCNMSITVAHSPQGKVVFDLLS